MLPTLMTQSTALVERLNALPAPLPGMGPLLQGLNVLGTIAKCYQSTLDYDLACKQLEADSERFRLQAQLASQALAQNHELAMTQLAQQQQQLAACLAVNADLAEQARQESALRSQQMMALLTRMLAEQTPAEEKQLCQELLLACNAAQSQTLLAGNLRFLALTENLSVAAQPAFTKPVKL